MFEELKAWFLEEGRDLPWRAKRTPYSTWVSEIMLQQTQVSVVIPYFHRWMERFPTIEALACAPFEEVVKLWEGLGYYSRAKNLQEGAREIVAKFQGRLPNDHEALLSIKGIGSYTAGAILSFAFHQKKGAVDGNIARVLSRLFLISDPIDVEKTKTLLLSKLEAHLPENAPWVAVEALIELGALICQKRPHCTECPLNSRCQAFKEGKTLELPKKKNKIKISDLYRDVGVIESASSLLLRKSNEKEVMGYLYELPYLETTKEGTSIAEIEAAFHHELSIPLEFEASLDEVRHGFTRYNVFLSPFHFLANEATVPPPYLWVKKELLSTIPFSAGHRKIVSAWQQSHKNLVY